MTTEALFSIIEDVTGALKSIENSERVLDDILDSGLKYPDLRRSTSNLLFNYYRHKCAVDQLLNSLCARPPETLLRHLLQCAVALCFFQDTSSRESAINAVVEFAKAKYGRPRANFVNAVLRRVATYPPDALDNAPLPEEVQKHWQKIYSPESISCFERLFRQIPPFSFRSIGAPLDENESTMLAATPLCGFEPFCFYETTSVAKLIASGLLESGRVYIQDPATSRAPALAQGCKATRILDLCSAPGGKSIYLSELFPTAEIVAFDRSSRRQELTKQNFNRYKVNGQVLNGDARNLPDSLGKFDLILIDVPCSNTGVFRRRPDALHNFSDTKLQGLREIQKEIIESAINLLALDGKLIYSTCSMEPSENQEAIQEFITAYPSFCLSAESCLLPQEHCDGAYAALLSRV